MDAGDAHDAGGLRKRKVKTNDSEKRNESITSTAEPTEKADVKSVLKVQKGTYWLTRIVLIRYIGFIYCKLVLTIVTGSKIRSVITCIQIICC